MTKTLGMDLGNKFIKICGEEGVFVQDSTLGEYRELKLQSSPLPTDIVYSYNGVKGFAGTLASRESEFAGSIKGDTKAHSDTLIRCLIGLHLYTTFYQVADDHFNVVVGQPITSHKHQEKETIKNLLKGTHEIEVNGIKKTFHVVNVLVAVEGASAYWSDNRKGKTRIIDVGSGTINYATIENGYYIDKDSDTIPFGTETTKSKDYAAMGRGIITELTNKWNRNDDVLLIGGAANDVYHHIKSYFVNTTVLYPFFKEALHPIFANAVGFYLLGVYAYEQTSQVN